MSLERIFKNLILAEFSLFVLLGFAVFYEPEELITLSENLGSGILDNDLGGIISIAFIIIYLVDLFLLYRFVNLAKFLFLLLFIVAIFLSLFSGPDLSTPLLNVLDWLDGAINGAILVFLYFTPIKDKFAK